MQESLARHVETKLSAEVEQMLVKLQERDNKQIKQELIAQTPGTPCSVSCSYILQHILFSFF